MRFLFTQLSLNIKQKFQFLYHIIDRIEYYIDTLRVGVVRFLADKPLDFHDTTFSVSLSLFQYHLVSPG